MLVLTILLLSSNTIAYQALNIDLTHIFSVKKHTIKLLSYKITNRYSTSHQTSFSDYSAKKSRENCTNGINGDFNDNTSAKISNGDNKNVFLRKVVGLKQANSTSNNHRSFGINPYDSKRSQPWPCIRILFNKGHCTSAN